MSSRHTISDYLEQAHHNATFAQYIRDKQNKYMDWSATCLFYSAVHLINAYLTRQGIAVPRRHRSKNVNEPGRTNIVQSDETLAAIYPAYRHLDDESRDARYELRKISQSDYDKFLKPKFDEIHDFILPRVAT